MPSRSGQPARSTGDRRVVVTGAGIITSMGNGWRPNAEGFREGRPAFRDITLFDTSALRVRQGGEVDLPVELPPNGLSARQAARLDRPSRLIIHAAVEACSQAAWKRTEAANPIPMVLGTSAGSMRNGEEFCRHAIDPAGGRTGQATRVLLYQTHQQARHLADALDIDGPVTIISNACASGANAIGHGFRMLKHGRENLDRVLAAGYDALAQLVFTGFNSLQALTSTLPPRPFDAGRDGLAIGEGAAVFCLETLGAARARDATILGEIVGYGAGTDIHHLTQPHPEGMAARQTMTAACREARLNPSDIRYINSHGTGTPLNDIAEANAIRTWAGPATSEVAVSSTKASIGHLLGAAGAVEAAVSLMAIEGNWLPPTCTIENPDPVCTFDLVREPRDARVDCVLTNSFGFGGANATLILKQFD